MQQLCFRPCAVCDITTKERPEISNWNLYFDSVSSWIIHLLQECIDSGIVYVDVVVGDMIGDLIGDVCGDSERQYLAMISMTARVFGLFLMETARQNSTRMCQNWMRILCCLYGSLHSIEMIGHCFAIIVLILDRFCSVLESVKRRFWLLLSHFMLLFLSSFLYLLLSFITQFKKKKN
eukprot:343655_1